MPALPSEPNRVRRAFVVCPSYHGATLLAMLLNRHPDVVDLGDTNPPTRETRCSCGRDVGHCEFWLGLRTELGLDVTRPAGRWLPTLPAFFGRRGADRALALGFSVANRIAGRPLDPLVSREAAKYRSVQDALIRYVTSQTGAKLFIDGEKSLAKAMLMCSGSRPPAHLIHLIRDPRGVAWSHLSRGRGEPVALGRRWRSSHARIFAARRLLGTASSITVRYEDLATDPQATMEDVSRFLHLDPPPWPPAAAPHTHQHVIGNRMVRSFDGRVALDESWRDGLSPSDAQAVVRAAGGLAERLGYR